MEIKLTKEMILLMEKAMVHVALKNSYSKDDISRLNTLVDAGFMVEYMYCNDGHVGLRTYVGISPKGVSTLMESQKDKIVALSKTPVKWKLLESVFSGEDDVETYAEQDKIKFTNQLVDEGYLVNTYHCNRGAPKILQVGVTGTGIVTLLSKIK